MKKNISTLFAVAIAAGVSVPVLTAISGPNGQPPAGVPKPILGSYMADPAIRVFGDRYYIYPTTDKPNWESTEFIAWSSADLVHWKKEGRVLNVAEDLQWARRQAWAPDCIERNGTYYFYFGAQGNIGVATAKSPVGPFADALSRPLVTQREKVRTFPIDPYPFIDEDGQAYLFFGSGKPMMFKLNPDMISLDGDPVELKLKDYQEGIVVFKRQGKYYFMWSAGDARTADYRVGYGMADSLRGPVKVPDNNIVLRQSGPVKSTGHHSVVQVPGTDRWYVAYHRHGVPDGNGFQRETCLARMEFNPDGTIRPMDPLTSPFKPGDAGEPLVNGRGQASGK